MFRLVVCLIVYISSSLDYMYQQTYIITSLLTLFFQVYTALGSMVLSVLGVSHSIREMLVDQIES